MKKRSIPGKSDLEAIRNQILDFACVAHDFRAETDEFLHNGDWNGVFVVDFRNHSEEERLYCSAPSGEHFIRFWLVIDIDSKVWQKEHEKFLRVASRYDVAIDPVPVKKEGDKRLCRLYSRVWVPGFSQRVFGLTLSNLMECKSAMLPIFSDQPGGMSVLS
ncbi:MAG: hypothetical protein DRH90_16915 [Deltaproteobacteria bacterium]|nr:MAG: hypothetical protein DRH90_16915 [Deltaproteobacteria bacterium]